jgi:hypothetical protein
VPEAVLGAVPEAQRMQSCVCEACVEKQNRAATSATSTCEVRLPLQTCDSADASDAARRARST